MANNYDWIKPGVHAWVAGLVLPVEVEITFLDIEHLYAKCNCGELYSHIHYSNIYQTESECLAVMKKEL